MSPCSTYVPSGYTSSSGGQLDSCLHCGRTKESHDLRLVWGDKDFAFESAGAARKAGFYVEV